MPYMTNGHRDYKKEVRLYTSKPRVVKKRMAQNRARALMMKKGLVHKGDGKHVDHIKPLSKGGGNEESNLRVVSASENESFRRNKKGGLISQFSKRERK